MQNWDFFGTKFGPWSHLGPSPKFGTSLERLHRGRQGCRHGVGKLCPNFFDLKLTTLQGVHGTLYCTLGLIVTELYCTRL